MTDPRAMVSVSKIAAQAQPSSSTGERVVARKPAKLQEFAALLRSSAPVPPERATGVWNWLGHFSTPVTQDAQRAPAGAREVLPPTAQEPSPSSSEPSGEHEHEHEVLDLPALLDPLSVVLAAPPSLSKPPTNEAMPRADFATAVEELVRRIAWGGERGSGVARIELGGGRYRGGVILVRTEGREVRVELDLPSGGDGELARRLEERLAEKGLSLAAPIR